MTHLFKLPYSEIGQVSSRASTSPQRRQPPDSLAIRAPPWSLRSSISSLSLLRPKIGLQLVTMKSASLLASLGCVALVLSVHCSAQTPDGSGLQPPAAFSAIADPAARSSALFTEAAKVLTHPRCMNCHPAGDRPLQGNDRHPHEPITTRQGTCITCHTDRNFTLLERASYRSIPGHPRWQLAPLEMAWEGKSVGEICRQMKDPDRNGGRDLELVHEHAANDDLVAWGWAPGVGRDPAPGTQELFGQLIKAWIDSGAQCP
jgi:hypothetical protein